MTWLLVKQPDDLWYAGIPVLAWIIASIFPDRELDLKNKIVTLNMRFLQKVTLFSWQWPIGDSHVIQIHVEAYGSPGSGNHGYVHKVCSVENRKRITVRDFVLRTKVHQDEISEFARSVGEALELKCEGYVEKPGFFWH
ncbi:hypothetical protein [Adhaeretor mobilis]|uniref:hypothetical protein n=1 Tax=Adhaeretor mobilis TaxID=1930276 RepID=UPI0011A55C9E|nr:hypothetical protein [Adhaeretor mobilis]